MTHPNYRNKFAYEFFINRQGYPPTNNCFPNQKRIDVWREVYAIRDAKSRDLWLLDLWQSFSRKWKKLRDTPFHIPKAEKILPPNNGV